MNTGILFENVVGRDANKSRGEMGDRIEQRNYFGKSGSICLLVNMPGKPSGFTNTFSVSL